jgi:hypothetical protein
MGNAIDSENESALPFLLVVKYLHLSGSPLLSNPQPQKKGIGRKKINSASRIVQGDWATLWHSAQMPLS